MLLTIVFTSLELLFVSDAQALFTNYLMFLVMGGAIWLPSTGTHDIWTVQVWSRLGIWPGKKEGLAVISSASNGHEGTVLTFGNDWPAEQTYRRYWGDRNRRQGPGGGCGGFERRETCMWAPGWIFLLANQPRSKGSSFCLIQLKGSLAGGSRENEDGMDLRSVRSLRAAWRS